jgi:3-hydroxybutyryl-CoA dehydratase
MHSPRDFSFDDIEVGGEFSHDYTVGEDVFDALVSAFNDRSPIHVDEIYAKAHGFRGRVMHGAILNGFLSHFVGMNFPGRRSLLTSVTINYNQPFYLNERISLTVRVRQKVESQNVIVLDFKFSNTGSEAKIAAGKAQVIVRGE